MHNIHRRDKPDGVLNYNAGQAERQILEKWGAYDRVMLTIMLYWFNFREFPFVQHGLLGVQ